MALKGSKALCSRVRVLKGSKALCSRVRVLKLCAVGLGLYISMQYCSKALRST